MARKLTESQKLVLLLQTRYSNKELSSLLGYKGTSQIRKISSGQRNPSSGVLDRLQFLINDLGLNPSRRTPRPSEIKAKQQTLRKTAWRKVSRETFLSSFPISDLFQLEAKLDKLSISYFYYNQGIDSFFLSNKENKNPVPNQTTGLLFEVSITKNEGTPDEYVIVQYPVYPVITIFSDIPDTFKEFYQYVLEYLKDLDDSRRYLDFEMQLYYEYVRQTDTLDFLAFVSIL